MKNCTKEMLESCRPDCNAIDYINFVLNNLYRDTKHELADRVCHNCTYEELIGTLLQARDELEEHGELEAYDELNRYYQEYGKNLK